MKLGWDPDIYPSSLDYEEALKSGKHFNNVNKEISSKKRIYDAQNKNFPSPTRSLPQPKKIGGLRLVFLILVIIGTVFPAIIEFTKPVTKEFFKDSPASSEGVLAAGISQLTSDSELPVYRISSENNGIENLIIPSQGSNLTTSSGLNKESSPYLVVSASEQTFDLFSISSATLDKEYMAPFLDESNKLTDGTYIDYAFPDFDLDGDLDAIIYISNDKDYPIVEVFMNQANENKGFSSIGYFESTPITHISANGLIQRIDENGSIYDQLIVDQDGVRILDNK